MSDDTSSHVRVSHLYDELLLFIIIIIMKRLKRRLTLKSNQSNNDWYRNVFKRRPKVSRDDAIDQTGKTTAISVTMLITIAKTVSDGFGGILAFAASLYVCPLQNDGQPSSMLDRDWGGESKPTPQTQIFSHQCGGHLQPVGV